MADRGIGDNGGPRLEKFTVKQKLERIRDVLDMDITAAQKCVGIGIVVEADADGVAVEITTKRLQKFASVSDRETVYRATKVLEAESVAKTIKVHGKPNSYRVLPPKVVEAIVEAYNASKGSPVKPDIGEQAQPDMGSPVEPDGMAWEHPAGSERTSPVQPVGPSLTSQAPPDASREQARAGLVNKNNKQKQQPNNLGGEYDATRAPPLMKFGFEGLRLNFTDEDVRRYAENYPELEYPKDLRTAEGIISRRASYGRTDAELQNDLESEIAKRANETRALRKQVEAAAASKADRASDESCLIKNGRIFVANGFEADLLEMVGGDTKRLRLELDKAAGFVAAKAKGEQLMLSVRSAIAKQVLWNQQDQRQTAADAEKESRAARTRRFATEAVEKVAAEAAKKSRPVAESTS